MDLQVPIEKLQACKLFVSTPMYGGQCAGMFTQSMADLSALCSQLKIPLMTHFLFNESLITRARNYCCDEFLRSGCTHLMFIDSDIGFDANDVIGLMALAISFPEKYDVICGPYPKKCISWEKVKIAVDKGVAEKDPEELAKYIGDYVFNPKAGNGSIPIGEPAEVMESGTGFMMITRDVLERYMKAFPEASYRPDHVRTAAFDGTREIHAFFDCVIDRGYSFGDLQRAAKEIAELDKYEGPEILEAQRKIKELLEKEKTASKRYLSEDYKFCYDVQSFGGKVWLCPWMKLKHVGSYVFAGSLADLAQIGAPATADINQLKKGRAATQQQPAATPPQTAVPRNNNGPKNRKARRAEKALAKK